MTAINSEYLELYNLISQNGLELEFVEEQNQTEELCILAVKQDGRALEYVEHQTEEICILAVQQDGYALEFVNEEFLTEKICMIAIQQNGMALWHVKEQYQTDELCILAVQQNCYAIQHVLNKDIAEKIYGLAYLGNVMLGLNYQYISYEEANAQEI